MLIFLTNAIICQKSPKSIALGHKLGVLRQNKQKTPKELVKIGRKIKTLVIIYSLAALLALGGVAAMSASRLGLYRTAADYSAALAFDETVSAVNELSLSLKKLRYVTDDVLGRSICANAYAQALSAEASLSVLPFSTHELEKLSAFLNTAADYSGSLIAQNEDELSEEQKQQVQQLGDAAGDFAARLSQLQSEVNDGSLLMDSLESARNRGGTELLSARLLSYEQEFESPEEFVYDGKYSPAEESPAGDMTEAEAKAIAAQAAGVEERELKEEYSYEGKDGRRCYSAGDLKLCVSSRGLESMGQSRLVSSGSLSGDEARAKAEEFLTGLGYEGLGLSQENISETIAAFRYAPEDEGALRLDDYISISIALDDGSVYSFDATRYRSEAPELKWQHDEAAAKKTLPENAQPENTRKLVIKSPGGSYLPCYEFQCPAEDGAAVRIYVNAETGRQCKIEYSL